MEGTVCYSRAETCKTELGIRKAAAPAGHSTTYCSRDRHRAQRAGALLCCPSDTFQNPRVHVLSTFRSGKALNAACMEAQRPGPNAEPASIHTLATLRRPTFLYAPILRADRNVARSRLCVVPGTRSLSAWTRVACMRWRTRTGPVSAAHNCAKVNDLELVFYLVRLSRLGRAPARHGPRPVGVHKCAKFNDVQRAVCRRCGNAGPLVPLELRNGTFCCGMFGGNQQVTSDNQQRHTTPYYTTPTKTSIAE